MKAIIFYIAVGVLGIALYVATHAYATDWRGYVAYGGELFFLAIPVYAAYRTAHTILEHIKHRKEDRHVES